MGYDAATESSKRVPDDIRGLVVRFEETGEVLPMEKLPELPKATNYGQQ